ncbi:MAG: hypothetical protein QXR15_01930, partial [Candidatus Hadarchaeales archaeon]
MTVFISIVGAPLTAAEWPVGRGNPARTGKAESKPFARVTRLELKGENRLGSNHLGSPVVADLGGRKVIFV